MKTMKLILKIILFTFLLAMCVLILSIIVSQTLLIKTTYQYKNEKLSYSIKVVQLSDLHNYQYGIKNQRLVNEVKKELPDIIFMTGDMLNDNENRTDILIDLINDLKEIAPVYVSLGNHEISFIEKFNEDKELIQMLEDAGATVLELEYVDTQINGQEVRIGGAFGYLMADVSELDWIDGSEQQFMEEFENTDKFKILLCHLPEGLLLWKSMEHWNVDLVFSGHVHGGQIRLPLIGGLYDPEEGLYPTYTKGMFRCGYGTVILSAGLGSSGIIPRINNLPEIVVCEMSGG